MAGDRFIPTRVGNTFWFRRGRACSDGSSPRVWGTPIAACHARVRPRFIPTRVGNTPSGRSAMRSAPVHPHACGEHYRHHGRETAYTGSSPRVWGTLLRGDALGLLVRFIPTRVGNTRVHLERLDGGSVHPHACGEHRGGESEGCDCIGSSPRVWGTPREN